MGNSEIPKQIMDLRLEGSRRVGRRKLRWMDGVVEDLGKLGIQRRKMVPGTDSCGRGFCGKSRFIVSCSATDETYKNIPVVA